MRNNLHDFRVKKRLTQQEIAERIGCTRAGYAAIENGNRNGKHEFWINFQQAFQIPDADLWGYMKND